VEPPKAKSIAPSPFELDRQRKQEQEEEPVAAPVRPEPAVVTPEPVAVVPSPKPEPVVIEVASEPVAAAPRLEPPPVPAPPQPERTSATGAPGLDHLRDLVATALDDQGHNTAASLLGAGRWKLDEDGGIQVEVGVKKTMLGLTMNAEAWKIVREALRSAGSTQKMMVVPGEVGETASASPKVFSRDSIEAVALGNPLVRQAQELFHAEVRSVLDLRNKGKS
jgi:DNA polymerase-3 subunit gamma/tau